MAPCASIVSDHRADISAHKQDQIVELPSFATGCSLAVSDTGLVEEEPDWAALNQVDDGHASAGRDSSAHGWQLNFKKAKARGRVQMQVCFIPAGFL